MDLKTSPLFSTLLGTSFTYAMTCVGAFMVFLKKEPGPRLLDTALGFAAGVMIAASFWSLLNPAIEISHTLGLKPWLVSSTGFLSGALFLRLIDLLLPHLHLGLPLSQAEGIKSNLKKSTLLILAITIHNLPEGMAVGVSFGTTGLGESSFGSAIAMTLGIGIQNLPEGLAISLPLLKDNMSRGKAFFYGQLSGLVEPLGGIFGVLFVEMANPILPFVLSFAAGAMIYVVVEEVIPESQSRGHGDWATMGAIFGFTIMMILDVALG